MILYILSPHVPPKLDKSPPYRFNARVKFVKTAMQAAIAKNRAPTPHRAQDLVLLFNDVFRAENTLLLSHADAWRTSASSVAKEPVYLPASADCPQHRIIFAHGYFSSALHEVAHWCLAGSHRRQLIDYGYWYRPDGRDAAQQTKFERVEARPQAIEWAFSIASHYSFQVSTDNLSGVTPDHDAFREKVREELRNFASRGFPSRAQRFIGALNNFYGTSFELPEHE